MSQDRFGPMDRVPPQNLEAEQAVLGSMMIERAAIEKGAEILKPEDFYRDAHRFIFEAILSLAEKDEPVDLITLPNELKSRNLFDTVGGSIYLMNLMDAPSTAANIEHYARLVEEKSILRRLLDAGTQIQGLAHSEFDTIDDVVDKSERIIFEVGQRRMGQFFYALRPLLDEELDRIEKRYENKGMTTGRQTPFADLNYMTAGLQPSDLIILAARPAMGKCLTARTRLDHPQTGERLTIQEYVQQRIPLVFGVSECGRIEHKAVGDWIDSGVQPCLRVTTLTGRVVEVTGHHPFLTVQGWTPLHDLETGSAIAVPRTVPAFGMDDRLPSDLVRLLAYFIAEGGLTGSSPAFTNTDPEIIADFQAILQTHYPSCHLRKEHSTYTVTQGRTGGKANPVTLWLRDWGLWGKYATEKAFPADAWRWTRPLMADFLRTLLSCGGTIYAMEGNPRIEFSVASQRLAEDVHHALTRFGIVAIIWQKRERCWRVEITEPEAVASFQTEIGWIGEKSSRFPQPLQRLASPDIYWDRIASIEPIGSHQVYDLTVPEGANFVAEDVFVHNTSLAMQLAQHIALEERLAVAIFSLEMSKEQLVNRMICSESRVDAQRLRTGFLQGDDWQRVGEGISRLAEAPIYIDDTPDISAMEMRAKCRRLQAEHGLGLIMIDYLQLMRSHKRTENRNQEISEIARACKSLARELKVPVMALSQLSRAVESRPDKRPILSDLRESGSIEAEADIVMFIYRDAYYKNKEAVDADDEQQQQQQRQDRGEEKVEEAEIIIAKQRNGPTGKVIIGWMGQYARFANLDRTRPMDSGE